MTTIVHSATERLALTPIRSANGDAGWLLEASDEDDTVDVPVTPEAAARLVRAIGGVAGEVLAEGSAADIAAWALDLVVADEYPNARGEAGSTYAGRRLAVVLLPEVRP